MAKIDAHQHFWKYDSTRHAWIGDEMSAIRKDFMPADLEPCLQSVGVDGCVLVQVDQDEEENDFQLENANAHDFIKGVVGWVDLRSSEVEERLVYYKRFPKMKGFRHILQGEKDRALMLSPSFKRGIGLLQRYGYTYDILIFPDQLGYTRELTMAFPDQKFVIDHVAKPYIRDKRLTAEWKSAIRAAAAQKNVYCKISGMVTEADYKQWKPEDLHPYIDVVVEAFGADRIMFGSDWPVCLVAASYQHWFELLQKYFSRYSETEQSAFFGGNAIEFYNL